MQRPGVFSTVNGLFLISLSLLMLAPFIHVIALSLSDPVSVQAQLVYFWPKGFQLDMYHKMLGMSQVWRALGVSIYITVVGTLITLALTSTMAFALSRPAMPKTKLIMKLLVLTFILPAPLIPGFLLVRSLGMVDTLWALMIPGATGAFNIIIMKTFFKNISGEIFDAAKIDGCGESKIYLKIVLPLSMAVLSTIGLFHAVGQWNSYFGALIFIRDKTKYPLQVLIQQLVVQKGATDLTGNGGGYTLMLALSPEIMSSAMIVLATVPILLVYPFLQKYFVQGAMLGSLKE